MIIFTASLRFCGQPHSGHAGAEMDGCKQVNGRSGWAPDGSHPVDGWPCDNLTHQPPPPLLCTITQADKQASTTEPGRREWGEGSSSGCGSVSSVLWQRVGQCLCIHTYILTPLLAGLIFQIYLHPAEITIVSVLLKIIFSSIILRLDEIWICHHGNHHIWFLFTCCHAPSIPIIRHYNHQ